MDQEKLQKELEYLLKKEALQKLLHQYRENLNRNVWTEETVRNLFTEDGIFVSPIGSTVQGHHDIVAAHQKMAGSFLSVLHSFSDQFVELKDDGEALLRFQMVVFHRFSPEKAAHMPGDLFIVKDQAEGSAVLEDDGWKFSHLKMQTIYKMMAIEQGPGGPARQ